MNNIEMKKLKNRSLMIQALMKMMMNFKIREREAVCAAVAALAILVAKGID